VAFIWSDPRQEEGHESEAEAKREILSRGRISDAKKAVNILKYEESKNGFVDGRQELKVKRSNKKMIKTRKPKLGVMAVGVAKCNVEKITLSIIKKQLPV